MKIAAPLHRPASRRAFALVAALAAGAGAAAEPPLEAKELLDLSLEDLGKIEITSVSKRSERLADAPASIFVINAEDIRRSGATTLPEVLRLAPNIEVAQISASSYAISVRGFNNSIGNKLQVLLDGRILYTPLFSGVFWDVHDTLIEDIERVEVISGAAATLWGSNAVNGVINIITRRASATQGGFASAVGGNLEREYAVRYGAANGDVAYRLYGKYFHRDDSERADGVSRHDDWHRGQVGFRADRGTPTEGLTVQGDAYRGTFDTVRPKDQEISGANLLVRWNHQLDPGNGVEVQAYADQSERSIPSSITERLNIYDVEFQQNLTARDTHQIVWGAGYRYARDHVVNAPTIAFLPANRNLHWSNVFVQDTMDLREDLKLTAGVRIGDNTYTGVEWMPTLRLEWKPGSSHLLWSALSRAVRSPSRLDRELFAPAEPPFVIAGGPDFRSEVSNVLGVGYRGQISPHSSIAVTAFHHEYDDLRSFERRPDGVFVIGNKMEGHGNGVEAWATWQVNPGWRLLAGGMLLDQDLRLKSDSTDPSGVPGAGNDPHNQWFVRSYLDLPWRMQLNAAVRHVGALPSPRVPEYTAVDLNVAWRPRDDVEIALIGRNLFDPGHPEFGNTLTASQIERSISLSVKWSF